MYLFHKSFNLAARYFKGKGTCLEFGVGCGDTYGYQVDLIVNKYPGMNLIGFDSWEGLPKETEGVWCPERHLESNLRFPKIRTLSRIPPGDGRFKLVDGFFKDSLTTDLQQTITDVVFVNIDVDIHSSTLDVLDFIAPIVQPGTILYWDDWKDPADENPTPWGEHLAWEEWYASQTYLEVETLEVNTVNQRSMLVTKTGDKRLFKKKNLKIRRLGLD